MDVLKGMRLTGAESRWLVMTDVMPRSHWGHTQMCAMPVRGVRGLKAPQATVRRARRRCSIRRNGEGCVQEMPCSRGIEVSRRKLNVFEKGHVPPVVL
jgi:hypothetical protein